MLDSLNSRGKAGIVFASLGVLLLVLGMIGYTITGAVSYTHLRAHET